MTFSPPICRMIPVCDCVSQFVNKTALTNFRIGTLEDPCRPNPSPSPRPKYCLSKIRRAYRISPLPPTNAFSNEHFRPDRIFLDLIN